MRLLGFDPVAGLARLYAVSLTGATDTLARPDSGSEGMTLEQIRDLPAAGIVPVANDDDFGVHGSGPERRRSFLWLVELGEALSGIPSR